MSGETYSYGKLEEGGVRPIEAAAFRSENRLIKFVCLFEKRNELYLLVDSQAGFANLYKHVVSFAEEPPKEIKRI